MIKIDGLRLNPWVMGMFKIRIVCPYCFNEADNQPGSTMRDPRRDPRGVVPRRGTKSQAKLLRALQPRSGDSPCTRWVRRIGGKEERKLDVRLVAATNQKLLECVSKRAFRDDLYYRLATVTIDLPPLRERRTEIELLAKDILGRINREFARTEPGYREKALTAPAMRKLKEHH